MSGCSTVQLELPGQAATLSRMAERVRALFGTECRRLLLIQPLQMSESATDVRTARQKRYYTFPPYGLGVLNANLKRRPGYEVRMLDLNYDVLAMLQDRPDATPEDMRACWQEKMAQAMAEFRPHMVGISAMYTMTHDMMAATADFSKRVAPAVPVVAGGVHVTNSKDTILGQVPSIDLLALYECDESFADLLDFVNGSLDQGALRHLGALIDGELTQLDQRQPPPVEAVNLAPDYGDLPLDKLTDVGEIGIFRFWREGRRGGSVISNRGCRARCSFCSVRNFNGPKVRGRAVEAVVDEMEELRDRYGIGHITWLDDDLFFDEKRAVLLFDEMVRRNLNMTWDTSNGVIASSAAAHPEMVEAAVRSGCIAMCFGIESGSPEVLKSVHKPSGVKHYLKVAEIMRQYPDVFTKGFLIIGFPHETMRQLRQTIDMAHEMALDWFSVQILTPLPSTEIYAELVRAGLATAGTLTAGVRESERQQRKERSDLRSFFRFDEAADDYHPTPEELHDIWFDVDFRINYPKLLTERHPSRLKKAKHYLTDICDRMTRDNPMTNLFLGRVLEAMGETDEAARRIGMARAYVTDSPYWRARFASVGVELP
ncbi:MAG: radical SAM protein [Alphaproteobacteria bacterium]|nr:radical SAM protein [Alphaproteobacteria bacterium]